MDSRNYLLGCLISLYTHWVNFYGQRGEPVTEVIKDTNWLQGEFISTVQQRGAAIIKARGASSAASAANACVQSIYNLTHDTPAGETFSISLCSSGQYGVDKGLIFSFPCRVEKGQLKVVEGFKQDDFGKEKFNITLEELRSEKAAVVELGLL
nr:hypothetical protein [Desulfobulbaceae bacterium]